MTLSQRMNTLGTLVVAAGLLASAAHPVRAQATVPSGKDGSILLTIMLKHDESKTLPEINAELRKSDWFRDFPPPGTEIVSWYVMMGIGQVVTLRLPANKLQEVNRVIENSAWSGFRTEFYPTYDYRQGWQEIKKRMNTP